MADLQGDTSDIIEIEGRRYLIPTALINGKLVPDFDKKLKLPIEITEGFHIHRRTTMNEPERTFKQWLVSLIK